MSNLNPRCIEIDGWIFEIKTIRAIKTSRYGEPYTAIANFTLQNDKAHIEGLMTKSDDDFTRQDHNTFIKYLSEIGIKEVSFERFYGEKFKTFTRDISPPSIEKPKFKVA